MLKSVAATPTPSMTTMPRATLLPASRTCHVAVLGAGASGLVTARELLREGHRVTIFEQGADIGGTWLFSDDAEAWSGPGGPSTSSGELRTVHSSMYANLRTNLPREIMGFLDFPMVPEVIGPASKDSRRYPGHEEVQSYLRTFAAHYDLVRHVRLSTHVVAVRPVEPTADSSKQTTGSAPAGAWPRWEVTARQAASTAAPAPTTESFDAVVSCVGNYSRPHLPDQVQGMADFRGVQMHSHSYRRPEAFAGQVVLVVGASFSGTDIGRAVSACARVVYMAANSWASPQEEAEPAEWGPNRNMYSRGMLSRLGADGSATFARGEPLPHVDAVIYCTGYEYSYPFLKETGLISTDAQYASPLYRHIYQPAIGPTLAFIGLPWKSLRFPQFELQSKLVARMLSGRVTLPSRQAMEDDMAACEAELLAAGFPLRYTHNQMGPVPMNQYVYNDWLCDMAGEPRPPTWRFDMYKVIGRPLPLEQPDTYRDHWDNAEPMLKLLDVAYDEFEVIIAQMHKAGGTRAAL